MKPQYYAGLINWPHLVFFQLHRGFMFMAAVATSVSIIVIFASVGQWSKVSRSRSNCMHKTILSTILNTILNTLIHTLMTTLYTLKAIGKRMLDSSYTWQC